MMILPFVLPFLLFVDTTVACHTTVACLPASNVCAVYSGFGPDAIEEVCNDDVEGCTIDYEGNYSITFELVQGMEQDGNVTECPECRTGDTITVTWDLDEFCLGVNTSIGPCRSCSPCDIEGGPESGNNITATFSADCRNLPGGIAVDCMSIWPVFYPFEPSEDGGFPLACSGKNEACTKSKDCCKSSHGCTKGKCNKCPKSCKKATGK
jgi:hypothetical protein